MRKQWFRRSPHASGDSDECDDAEANSSCDELTSAGKIHFEGFALLLATGTLLKKREKGMPSML